MAVRRLYSGILPAETLVVVINKGFTGVSDPDARAGAKVAFFGDFVCSAADTAEGRIGVAAGLWGNYRFAGFDLSGGDVLTGPYPAEFSRGDLRHAANGPEVTARRGELAGLESLVLCKVTGNITWTTWRDSIQCEPIRALFGPMPRIAPLRLAFQSPECGANILLGDTLVIPLRSGEPELDHTKPLCLEDLRVRNGFVKQFGCFFERIVERCYVEAGGLLEPRLTPGRGRGYLGRGRFSGGD
ncbi:MAG TPA: hypothetical protein VI504_16440 [Candidatus Eisenbacteria bacterium]